MIAWQDRDAFAAEVLSVAAEPGAGGWINYPGKPAALAVRVRFEPFDHDNPDCQPLAGLTEGLNSYSGSFAKATVDYQSIDPQDFAGGPTVEPGTRLTHQLLYSVATESLFSGGWTWSDQPWAAVPANLAPTKQVPLAEHHLIWDLVVAPPWDAIRDLQGQVNAAEFLGCPAGTLLFLGVQSTKVYRSDLATGAAEFSWQLHYLFRQRAIKQGGQVLGWNHFWRPDPPGWATLVNSSGPFYDAADFSGLFQSAAQ